MLRPVKSKRLYEAAQSSEYHKPPDASGAADYVVNRAGQRLRDYARWLDENNDLTIGALDVLVNNIVGTGVQVEPQVKDKKGKPADKVNLKLRDLWRKAEMSLDIAGDMPFAEMQRLACRTWLRDGEVFAEHVQGNVNANRNRNIPYCVRLREPDWVPFELVTKSPIVTHGIEKDQDGIPVAYHFYKSLTDPLYLRFNHDFDTMRVPAERVEHLKFSRRLNQTRGVTILHGVINRLDDIKDAEESERMAMRVSAAWVAAIVRNPDMIASDIPGFATEDGSITDRYKDRYFDMSPGMMFDNLLPGEDIKGIGLERPNNNLIEFLNDQHRRFAAGIGASHSSISKRYDGTYSAQRQELVEQAPAYNRMRNLFIAKFVKPIYERYVYWALFTGELKIPRNIDKEAVLLADFRAPGIPWIDPKKEMEADAIAVASGFKSRHMVIRERGYDPELVDQQIESDSLDPKNPITSDDPEEPETDDSDTEEEDSA